MSAAPKKVKNLFPEVALNLSIIETSI